MGCYLSRLFFFRDLECFLAGLFTFKACLHGGGGPQVGEVTFGGSSHLPCKRDEIKMRDYMDRRVTPPKRVTSPIWGPPPPCKQAVTLLCRFTPLVAMFSLGSNC